MATRVALVGANGYGAQHRRAMMPMTVAGTVSLVGLCDVMPICDAPGAPVPSGVPQFSDYRRLLADTAPDVVIVATPPHTHLQIACAAAEVGADVLVEKPPVLSLGEHSTLEQLLHDTGRVCQVGFQALGSQALHRCMDAVREGHLGDVTAISVFGAWRRPDSYYTRSAWAGQRELDGRRVLDGALVNPFAHALMQCLALAEACGPAAATKVELERFRARRIDVDDTCFARLTLASGVLIVAAVTLCADEVMEPEILVHGSEGSAVLNYTTDRLALPGTPATPLPGRTDLLSNLIEHRSDQAAPLIAPLSRTVEFTRFVESVFDDSPPTAIPATSVVPNGIGADRTLIVPGITRLVRAAAQEVALASELSPPTTNPLFESGGEWA